jgi:hypothetical protein
MCQYSWAPEQLFISLIDETIKAWIGVKSHIPYIVKAFRLCMLRTIFSRTHNLDADTSSSSRASSSMVKKLRGYIKMTIGTMRRDTRDRRTTYV